MHNDSSRRPDSRPGPTAGRVLHHAATGPCALRALLALGMTLVALAGWLQPASAIGMLPDFTDIVAKATPAVLNISSESTSRPANPMREFLRHYGQGAPFDELFRDFDRFFEVPGTGRRRQALGTGVLISPEGLILTNGHVIQGATSITVVLRQADGQDAGYKARVLALDRTMDLALLKIDAKASLPFLEFGDSRRLKPGEWVVAIGNPFGFGNSVTVGVVSGTGRSIGAGPFDNFIQTDASINPGNSGGPLLNTRGEIVGINTAIVAAGQGIGFAIPSEQAREWLSRLLQAADPGQRPSPRRSRK